MESLIIPNEVVSEIEAHAREQAPNECCGVLGGIARRITTRYPLRNASETPLTNYFAAPSDIFAAMRGMRLAGQQLLAIYHSHPQGSAYPSQTDIDLAFYPEVFHLLVSLAGGFELRAFRIADRRVEPVEMLIEPDARTCQ